MVHFCRIETYHSFCEMTKLMKAVIKIFTNMLPYETLKYYIAENILQNLDLNNLHPTGLNLLQATFLKTGSEQIFTEL